MKASPKKDKEFWDRIDQLLWEVWDPINLNDSDYCDEYKGYVPSIHRLIADGGSKKEIVDLLFQHANVNMGLSTEKNDHLFAAQCLIDLRDEFMN